MTLDEIQSRMEIQEVLYRYCRGIDRGDADLVAGVFHGDAVDEHGGFDGLGVDFAYQVVERMKDNPSIGQHNIGNILISFSSPDKAVSEAYCVALAPDPAGNRAVVWIRYLDDFERRAGLWKIAHRKVIIDDAWTDSTSQPWNRITPFIRGARGSADPSAGRI